VPRVRRLPSYRSAPLALQAITLRRRAPVQHLHPEIPTMPVLQSRLPNAASGGGNCNWWRWTEVLRQWALVRRLHVRSSRCHYCKADHWMLAVAGAIAAGGRRRYYIGGHWYCQGRASLLPPFYVLLHSWYENAALEDFFCYNSSAIFASKSRRRTSPEFFLHDATIEDFCCYIWSQNPCHTTDRSSDRFSGAKRSRPAWVNSLSPSILLFCD
jgi:hypothetical protein